MTLADHPFERNANPRSPRSCSRCGRVPEVHPVPPKDPPRDIDDEVRVVAELAEQAGLAVDDLIAFSQSRARPEPVRDFHDRDFGVDAAEEKADDLNYHVWWLQAVRHRRGDWADLDQAIRQSMVASGRAWEALQHARSVEARIRRLHEANGLIAQATNVGGR